MANPILGANWSADRSHRERQDGQYKVVRTAQHRKQNYDSKFWAEKLQKLASFADKKWMLTGNPV